MAFQSEFVHLSPRLAAPPADTALLARICSVSDFEFVRERLGAARARQQRRARLRIFHSAMMDMSRHIGEVMRQDWSSSGLAAGQIVLAGWRARLSWISTYVSGVCQISGAASIGVQSPSRHMFDALATITGQIR